MFSSARFPGEKTRHQQKGSNKTLEKKHPTICGGFFSGAKELKTKNPANVLFVGTEGVRWQLATDVFRVFEALFMTRQIDTPSFVGFLH